jgi:hypothetical protein
MELKTGAFILSIANDGPTVGSIEKREAARLLRCTAELFQVS